MHASILFLLLLLVISDTPREISRKVEAAETAAVGGRWLEAITLADDVLDRVCSASCCGELRHVV